MFRVFKEQPEEFLKEIDLTPISRTIFNQFKEDYKALDKFSEIEKAVRIYYLIKAGFGSSLPGGGGSGFGIGTESSSRLNLTVLERDIRNTYERIKRVFIENLDFKDLIKRYDKEHTLFYCDPPYVDSRQYITKFDTDDHRKLADVLSNIKGNFILSINPHLLAYELYDSYNIVEVDHNYSMRKNTHNTDCKELLIFNFELGN